MTVTEQGTCVAQDGNSMGADLDYWGQFPQPQGYILHGTLHNPQQLREGH